MPWPKKVSAFARPGEVFAYSHIGPANPYWTFSEQMYPVWWPGPHRKAGAPVVYDYVQDVEVVCGTNGFIFADGHVSFMSWMQTRCWLADHVDPVTKHLNVGFLSYAIGPSQCSAHAEANGLTTWCSCEPAAGQQ